MSMNNKVLHSFFFASFASVLTISKPCGTNKKWKRDISKQDNLYCSEPKDYFVYLMGQHIELAYRTKAVNDNEDESEISVYHATICQGCPLRNKCHKRKQGD